MRRVPIFAMMRALTIAFFIAGIFHTASQVAGDEQCEHNAFS